MTNPMRRRAVLRIAAAGAAGLFVPRPRRARAQTPTGAPPPLAPLNRFPRMVHEHLLGRMRAIQEEADRVLAGLTTRAEAEAHVARVRERVRACFGPLPPRTPLNPRVAGRLERDRYVVEKVLFESRPRFLVSGNLYLPKGPTARRPAVLGLCGHSELGKAGDAYQSFAQGLARLGYVVLIIDPWGQGERMERVPEGQPGLPRALFSPTGAHLHAGNQQTLVGETFATWRLWDAIRGLDYLLSRPEVDPKHVGVTGNSGGGTITTWVCAVEDRITMGAPSCFVTTFLRNAENELPADTEQYPPGALAAGLNLSDFLVPMAPRPLLVMGQKLDFFDPRGTDEEVRRLRRVYALLGAPDNVRLFIGPQKHGFFAENRTAMYGFFGRFTGIAAESEPAIALEKPEDLRCTKTGLVTDSGSVTVADFTRARSLRLGKARRRLGASDLKQAVARALGLRVENGAPAPEHRNLRPLHGRGHAAHEHTAVLMVQTEPGIHAVVYRLDKETDALYALPPSVPPRALLYVAHHSSDAELRSEPLLRELVAAEAKATCYACDVRGIGESQPDTCGSNTFLEPYGSDYFYAGHARMLGESVPGRRTHDLLRVIAWLGRAGHKEVHLAALGWGAVPAAFAALLSDAVVAVTLKNAPASYSAIAESRAYDWPLSAFVPGVLASFDLPDVYAALAAKSLRQIAPAGPVAGSRLRARDQGPEAVSERKGT